MHQIAIDIETLDELVVVVDWLSSDASVDHLLLHGLVQGVDCVNVISKLCCQELKVLRCGSPVLLLVFAVHRELIQDFLCLNHVLPQLFFSL